MVLHSSVWDSILNLAELAEPRFVHFTNLNCGAAIEVGEVNSLPVNYGMSFKH
jgi:hypothetical protein